MSQIVDTILVPQGAEYRAVCRGRGQNAAPTVVPIPIGSAPLSQCLTTWQQATRVSAGHRVLVMGLCGGLTPRHAIADVVLYQGCINGTDARSSLTCDDALTAQIQAKLTVPSTQVRALTSDRLVWSAIEKQQLAQRYGTDVVDMEGFAALEQLQQWGVAIAMLRVVSDNAQHDLPDLTAAIDANGSLQPLSLAWGMIRQPIAATRLIRGSLKGLKTLQAVTTRLCSETMGASRS